MSPNSIIHLRILHTNSLQLQTQSNTSHLSKQTPYSSQLNQISYNSPNKLPTTPNAVRYLLSFLATSSQLSTQSNTSQFFQQTPYSSQLNQIPEILLLTPYSSQLNQIPHISPNKLLTALNSIRYLTFLLTFSLQLPTQSDTLISPNKLLTALNSIRYLKFLLHSPYVSQLNQIPQNSPNKLLTALNSIRIPYISPNILLTLPTQSDTLHFS